MKLRHAALDRRYRDHRRLRRPTAVGRPAGMPPDRDCARCACAASGAVYWPAGFWSGVGYQRAMIVGGAPARFSLPRRRRSSPAPARRSRRWFIARAAWRRRRRADARRATVTASPCCGGHGSCIPKAFRFCCLISRRMAKAPAHASPSVGSKALMPRLLLRSCANASPNEKIGAIGSSLGGASALAGPAPLAIDALVLESGLFRHRLNSDRVNDTLGLWLGPCCRRRSRAALRAWLFEAILRRSPADLRPMDSSWPALRAPLLMRSDRRHLHDGRAKPARCSRVRRSRSSSGSSMAPVMSICEGYARARYSRRVPSFGLSAQHVTFRRPPCPAIPHRSEERIHVRHAADRGRRRRAHGAHADPGDFRDDGLMLAGAVERRARR